MKRLLCLIGLIAITTATLWPQNAEHLDIMKTANLRTASTTWDSVSVSTNTILRKTKVSFLNTGPDTLVIAKGADTTLFTTDLQLNGTFETDSSYWNVYAGTYLTTASQAYADSKSLELVATGAGAALYSDNILNRTANELIQTVYVRVGHEASDTTVKVQITDLNNTVIASTTKELSRATWTLITVRAVLPGTQSGIRTRVRFATGVEDDSLWIDSASLKRAYDGAVYLAPNMSYVDDAWPLGYLRVKSYGSVGLTRYYMTLGGGETRYEPALNAIGQFIDSTGTATVYWQEVDLLSAAARRMEVQNGGTINLRVALSAADTVVSQTRHQPLVYPSAGFQFYTNSRYIYVRSASSTSAYRIRNY